MLARDTITGGVHEEDAGLDAADDNVVVAATTDLAIHFLATDVVITGAAPHSVPDRDGKLISLFSVARRRASLSAISLRACSRSLHGTDEDI
jgi:ABC-type hemin transport system ATPase subunit